MMASTDPDIEIMHYCKHKLTTRSEMKVSLKVDYNRRSLPQSKEQNIVDVWTARVKKNPKLYNGTKFRIDSVSCGNDATFVINLGVTCYMDYLGTNWSPEVKQIRELGEKDCGNYQVYLSDPLGVGSLVVTSDNFVMLLRRSIHCGEAAGLWDVPGGHPEPEELVGKIPIEEIDLSAMESNAVCNEVFDSIIREIRDEVNLPQSSLSDPQVMGIARNTTSAGRPSMEFLVRCSLTSTEVEALYRQGNQTEAEESTNIKLLPLDNVISLQTTDKELWSNLAPSAKGCLILYRLSHIGEDS